MKTSLIHPFGSTIICALALVIVGWFAACNHPFDPRGPLENDAVVFSVLSTDRSLQFVRVEHTYMPIGFDALTYTSDNFIPNALVTIQKGDSTFTLKDTAFARPDTSRFKFPIKAYCANPLGIDYGASYRLWVQSPEIGKASTTIAVPDKPTITLFPSSVAVLQYPSVHQDSAEIIYTLDLASGAKGWIGRLYICYNVLKGGNWIEERAEVPIYYIFPTFFDDGVYGHITRSGYQNRSAAVYRNDRYSKAIIKIVYDMYPNTKITFTRAVLQLVQLEENLYNYYEVAHGNGDPYSVRLDEPLYTNLVGGVGVVGAYTLDSLVQALPDNFFGNRQ